MRTRDLIKKTSPIKMSCPDFNNLLYCPNGPDCPKKHNYKQFDRPLLQKHLARFIDIQTNQFNTVIKNLARINKKLNQLEDNVNGIYEKIGLITVTNNRVKEIKEDINDIKDALRSGGIPLCIGSIQPTQDRGLRQGANSNKTLNQRSGFLARMKAESLLHRDGNGEKVEKKPISKAKNSTLPRSRIFENRSLQTQLTLTATESSKTSKHQSKSSTVINNTNLIDLKNNPEESSKGADLMKDSREISLTSIQNQSGHKNSPDIDLLLPYATSQEQLLEHQQVQQKQSIKKPQSREEGASAGIIKDVTNKLINIFIKRKAMKSSSDTIVESNISTPLEKPINPYEYQTEIQKLLNNSNMQALMVLLCDIKKQRGESGFPTMQTVPSTELHQDIKKRLIDLREEFLAPDINVENLYEEIITNTYGNFEEEIYHEGSTDSSPDPTDNNWYENVPLSQSMNGLESESTNLTGITNEYRSPDNSIDPVEVPQSNGEEENMTASRLVE